MTVTPEAAGSRPVDRAQRATIAAAIGDSLIR